MGLLFICIAFNVSVGILFKVFSRWQIDVQQAIVVNYIFCFISAGFVQGDIPITPSILHEPWMPYALALGVFFIIVFNIIAMTVKYTGVMVTSIFQRMSLVAPAFIAMVFFSEPSNFQKWAGIAIALISVVLLSLNPASQEAREKTSYQMWLFPALTFLGSAIVDSSLFLAEHFKIASGTDVRFLATLFFFAGVTGVIWMVYLFAAGKKIWQWKSLGAGALLGVLNFNSIYFLIYALHSGWDGSVLFPVNNIGVLLISAVTGIVIFKEQLTKIKALGFVFATIAILLLSFS